MSGVSGVVVDFKGDFLHHFRNTSGVKNSKSGVVFDLQGFFRKTPVV